MSILGFIMMGLGIVILFEVGSATLWDSKDRHERRKEEKLLRNRYYF